MPDRVNNHKTWYMSDTLFLQGVGLELNRPSVSSEIIFHSNELRGSCRPIKPLKYYAGFIDEDVYE